MKKIAKPTKQPTKKQNVKTVKYTKLKTAIGKIAEQLIKDHPKLVKKGSSGYTDLILNKKLMKGGNISDDTINKIISFLKKYAKEVDKIKKELIINLIEIMIRNDIKTDMIGGFDNFSRTVVIINEYLNHQLYDYDINFIEELDNTNFNQDSFPEVKEKIALLIIMKEYFKLSKLNNSADLKIIPEIKFHNIDEKDLEVIGGYNLNKNTAEEIKTIKTIITKYKNDNGTSPVSTATPLTPAPPSPTPQPNKSNDELELELRITAALAAIPVIEAAISAGEDEINKENLVKNVQTEAVKAIIAKQISDAVIASVSTISTKLTEAIAASAIAGIIAVYEKEAEAAEAAEAAAEAAVDGASAGVKEPLHNAAIAATAKVISAKKFADVIKPTDDQTEAVNTEISIASLNPRQETPKMLIRKAVAAAAAATDVDATDEQRTVAIDKVLQEFTGGRLHPKYKSTGQVVFILYKKRKYKRTIFLKEKRKTKYCKINNEYILLSKLKVIE